MTAPPATAPPEPVEASSGLPGEVSVDVLADLLGVSPRTLGKWVDAGIIRRSARGRFPLRESLRAAFAHAQAPRAATGDKARLLAAQAEKVELANAAKRAELVPAAAVAHEWASMLAQLRAAMLAVSSRFHARRAHLTPGDIAELDRVIRDALEDQANDGI
ncbi:hypothetical protein VQH23_12955 [Pararoseomonas sp. SCSIO 73927]|uniref:hypothetical protein n=1 Tax=Pararoseomonas sp. SCSIO 73927 TaxID=3114537 RepID=UPI0030CAA51D